MVSMERCLKIILKVKQVQICYYNCKLPNGWKSDYAVLVHKIGSMNDVESYRPISLISLVAKTLERIIRDALIVVMS